MRRPLVAGNWKMNGTRKGAMSLIAGLLQGADSVEGVDILVCPPYPFLCEAARELAGGPLVLGAQNVSEHENGAYTGEVSAAMLADYGCRYVIVGHSERRALYGEDDTRVARKFIAARQAGLVPVLCVGETLAEHEAGHTESVVMHQLQAVLDVSGVEAFADAVVAYEPVWAIGTGRTASPGQAQDVHAMIRETISGQDATISKSLRILYGGSVKGSNAASLFGMTDVDGGLVGGASLDSDEFLGICRAAARTD